MSEVLILGGAKQLGRSIAIELAEKGWPILLHYRSSEQEAEETVIQCQRLGVAARKVYGELGSQRGRLQFLQEIKEGIPSLSGLVYNVGPYLHQPLCQTGKRDWDELMELNFHAPRELCEGLLPDLEQGKGAVVMMGMAGLEGPKVDLKRPVYKLSKRALLDYMRSLAKELAPRGVTVNMVSPGYLEHSVELPHPWPAYSMGRPGTCEEVARVVSFFFDENHRYITGQNLEVAGGIAL